MRKSGGQVLLAVLSGSQSSDVNGARPTFRECNECFGFNKEEGSLYVLWWETEMEGDNLF